MPAGLCSMFISLQFISSDICMKEKVLILPEMKKRTWEITNCPWWCSGITWSVSQGSRAWTFLILMLSMDPRDNQGHYGHVTHISQWWQYSSGWQYLYMGRWDNLLMSEHPLLLCNCQPLCSLLTEWSDAVNTKSYRSRLFSSEAASLSNLNGSLGYFIEILRCFVVWAMEIW